MYMDCKVNPSGIWVLQLVFSGFKLYIFRSQTSQTVIHVPLYPLFSLGDRSSFLLSTFNSVHIIRPVFVHCLFDSVDAIPYFLSSYPSPREQCSTSGLWWNLFSLSENLVKQFVQISSHGVAASLLLQYHSEA